MLCRHIYAPTLIISVLLLMACLGNNGPADDPPVQTLEGTPTGPDETIPPLTAEELQRFQREIVDQYQEIDQAYERLDDAYEYALQREVLKTPQEIQEHHQRLATRHEAIAQMHEGRIQVILDVPSVIENDLELVEINRILAA
ncbi:MAG: hypothetical protein ACNA8W_25365, partial [Bradymonadaceae bacterium]